VDTWVLNGSDGTTLAFAPGMSAGSVAPGQNGVIVIGAHRDTHFRNLQFIAVGDTIRLQDKHRRWHEYRITKTSIADVRTDEIVVRHDRPRLLLVTCYPFDALMPGGPLRYVLDAELV
jgi:sortase A